ncbi:hypothetical protein JAO76_07980 [Pontibacter sp. BT310]|uniref:Uncharacterized protein n=1 Tax=Pontibacter populi TaxID=890055 RepID=A0ABS6XAF0_9BACT|nr:MULTISPECIES: hypothetical protein [Pontibacter]MBJ6118124.1 hypothetical protein [Pontibacter sp. BT310]MBR0570551.1 hypothetical protein [Microvirga sp. STS03]MBW3364977.1 hypothetical protein [Pontibacter populi]
MLGKGQRWYKEEVILVYGAFMQANGLGHAANEAKPRMNPVPSWRELILVASFVLSALK